MNLPKSITILGQEFSIELKPQKEIEKEIGAGTFGAVNYSDRRILISNDVNEIDFQIIAFHEFLHALQFVSGVSQTIGPDLQEVISESFANGIIEILKQLYKPRAKKKQSNNGSRKRQRGAPGRHQGRRPRAH